MSAVDPRAPARPVAVVTGASGGIGAATARALAAAGFDLVLGARRVDRLRDVAASLPLAGGEAAATRAVALPLDVTSTSSVERFAAAIERADVLVANAGLSLGLDRVADAVDARWTTMFETNVMGVMRSARALLPRLEASGNGHLVVIGSIAGFEVYPGGGGYTASKHAAHALVGTLRLELLGKPVRVTEIAPGLVETDFSRVRFDGDEERAAAVYRGLEPLTAEDIADVVAFAVTRPPRVNLDLIVVRPRDQATARDVHRR